MVCACLWRGAAEEGFFVFPICGGNFKNWKWLLVGFFIVISTFYFSLLRFMRLLLMYMYCLMSKMFERSYKSIIFYLLDIKLINIIFLSFFHWATIIIYKIEVKYYSN